MEIKDNYTQNEWIELFMGNVDLSVYGAIEDKKLYEEYIATKAIDDESKINEMEIYYCLSLLGFKLEQLGTYYYKEIINRLLQIIPSIFENNDIEQLEQLLISLKNKFSQFYFDIAVNEQDTGLKTFHRIIKEAKDNRNKPDELLSKKIFNNEPLDEDLEPLAIAKYLNEVVLTKNKKINNGSVPRLQMKDE